MAWHRLGVAEVAVEPNYDRGASLVTVAQRCVKCGAAYIQALELGERTDRWSFWCVTDDSGPEDDEPSCIRKGNNQISPDVVSRLHELRSGGASLREVARVLNISRETVRAYAGSGDQVAGLKRHHARRKAGRAAPSCLHGSESATRGPAAVEPPPEPAKPPAPAVPPAEYFDPRDTRPLSKEEQIRLGTLARDGNTKARDRLVASCEALARKVAAKYARIAPHLDEDILAAAHEALAVSVSRYDPSLGFTFSGFAYNYLTWACRRTLNEQRCAVTPPRNARSAANNPRVTSESLTIVTADGEEQADIEVVPEERDLILTRALTKMVDTLPTRERTVITLRFVEGWTLQQIGDAFGRSRELIRQIEESAMKKLRRLAGDAFKTPTPTPPTEVRSPAQTRRLAAKVAELKERNRRRGSNKKSPVAGVTDDGA